MKSFEPQRICSADLSTVLVAAAPGEVWEFDYGRSIAATRGEEIAAVSESGQTAARASAALRSPLDFPSASEITVPGDQIALAVDPNVPELASVLRGCIEVLWQPGEPPLQVVLWEEASERLVADLSQRCGEAAEIRRHQSADRSSLSYLAADADANPIYLNRTLVDADVVLPIVAQRFREQSHDPASTGLFPHFADSASRQRFLRERQPAPTSYRSSSPEQSQPEQSQPVDWLLGIQLLLSVRPDSFGNAGEIEAGTPEGIDRASTETDPPAPAALIVACLEGDREQQSWSNATRAIAAARRHVQPGGTIVLWSALAEPPPAGLQRRLERGEGNEGSEGEWQLDQLNFDDAEAREEDGEHEGGGGPLPAWSEAAELAPLLRSILDEHRVLIHSHLDQETVESMSLGFIKDAEELCRLSGQFAPVGVLRAAQFAGSSLPPACWREIG